MKKFSKIFAGVALAGLFFFGVSIAVETIAWARAGGGGSMGSRGGRSFSSPVKPSSPSFGGSGLNTPPRNPSPGQIGPSPSTGGLFGRSPFMQGLAGGLAGGLLGSLLFGGVGHASSGGMGAGGIGLMDLALIGLLLFLAYRFFRNRRARAYSAAGQFAAAAQSRTMYEGVSHDPVSSRPEVELGFQRLRQADPAFSEEALNETFQDIFFRVQAAWMNRSLDGIENLVSPEMAEYLKGEFETMKSRGTINRLENIAIRKVEPSEIWQETGRDFVTVLITANLLDYMVDDGTGGIVGGDKLNPVKFQEFWTFSRETGSSQWRLTAINQIYEAGN